MPNAAQTHRTRSPRVPAIAASLFQNATEKCYARNTDDGGGASVHARTSVHTHTHILHTNNICILIYIYKHTTCTRFLRTVRRPVRNATDAHVRTYDVQQHASAFARRPDITSRHDAKLKKRNTNPGRLFKQKTIARNIYFIRKKRRSFMSQYHAIYPESSTRTV